MKTMTKQKDNAINDLAVQNNFVGWKSLIQENPNEQDFREAWKIIFEFYPEDCRLLSGFSDDRNTGFEVRTPKGVYYHAGFGFHTDEPVLSNKSVWFDGRGCNWGVDDNGDRFYYLNKQTKLPDDWKDAKSIEIIKRFIKNNMFPTNLAIE